MNSSIIDYELISYTDSVFCRCFCLNFPMDFTHKYVENLQKASMRSDKFILLWCVKKWKKTYMEQQCSSGKMSM